MRDGLYEVEQRGKVAYAIGQDGYWSDERKLVGQLLDEFHVGTLLFKPGWPRSLGAALSVILIRSRQHTGLSLRACVRIGAIIAHDDNSSPVNTVMHLASRSTLFEDSFVAICGVTPPSGKARIWNLGPQLKVLKGQPSRICEQCEALACDAAADAALFAPPVAHADIPARAGPSNSGASGATANAGTSGPAGNLSMRCMATRNAAGLFETPFIPIKYEDGSLYLGLSRVACFYRTKIGFVAQIGPYSALVWARGKLMACMPQPERSASLAGASGSSGVAIAEAASSRPSCIASSCLVSASWRVTSTARSPSYRCVPLC